MYSSNQAGVLIKKLKEICHLIEVVCFSIDETKASIESTKRSVYFFVSKSIFKFKEYLKMTEPKMYLSLKYFLVASVQKFNQTKNDCR